MMGVCHSVSDGIGCMAAGAPDASGGADPDIGVVSMPFGAVTVSSAAGWAILTGIAASRPGVWVGVPRLVHYV